MERVVQR